MIVLMVTQNLSGNNHRIISWIRYTVVQHTQLRYTCNYITSDIWQSTWYTKRARWRLTILAITETQSWLFNTLLMKSTLHFNVLKRGDYFVCLRLLSRNITYFDRWSRNQLIIDETPLMWVFYIIFIRIPAIYFNRYSQHELVCFVLIHVITKCIMHTNRQQTIEALMVTDAIRFLFIPTIIILSIFYQLRRISTNCSFFSYYGAPRLQNCTGRRERVVKISLVLKVIYSN